MERERPRTTCCGVPVVWTRCEYWEDDNLQYRDPDYEGGANAESLRQAQRNFQSFGAMSKDAISNVRKATPEDKRKRNWKPL